MRYVTLGEVVALHRAILEVSGGAPGIRDLGALESALAQPRASFGDADLHPSLHAKAAALGFSTRAQSPVPRRQQARRPRGDGGVLDPERLRDRRDR
jgi:death on curing protein